MGGKIFCIDFLSRNRVTLRLCCDNRSEINEILANHHSIDFLEFCSNVSNLDYTFSQP
jgi:hypothetical protein